MKVEKRRRKLIARLLQLTLKPNSKSRSRSMIGRRGRKRRSITTRNMTVMELMRGNTTAYTVSVD